MTGIKLVITEAVAKLRAEAKNLEVKANALEAHAETLPDEIEGLAETLSAKIHTWIQEVL